MARYIDAEVLKSRLEDFSRWCKDGRKEGVDFVLDCPLPDTDTADVQEVRHGKWIGYPSISISKRRRTVQSIIYKCSCCGKSNGRAKSPYCKNCGSKMCGDKAEAKIKELEGKI